MQLNKKGHSFEVDIWAIGCILYTLLVGKPPFETTSLKVRRHRLLSLDRVARRRGFQETYQKIRKNDYHTPSRVSNAAKELIAKLLDAEPHRRPTISQIPDFPFFSSGYMPARLPTSCLTMAPKFPSSAATAAGTLALHRRALSEVQPMETGLSPKEQVRKDLAGQARFLGAVPENGMGMGGGGGRALSEDEGKDGAPADGYLRDLFAQLDDLLKTDPVAKLRPDIAFEDAESPEAAPVFWVSKWVDYSDKYGLGYQLCDDRSLFPYPPSSLHPTSAPIAAWVSSSTTPPDSSWTARASSCSTWRRRAKSSSTPSPRPPRSSTRKSPSSSTSGIT